MSLSFLRSIWIICKKDLQVWARRPLLLFGTLLVPMTYFLVVFAGSAAVGRQPVAVCNLDSGRIGAQIAEAIVQADVFRVSLVNAQQARDLYAQLSVAAIITLPPNFSHQVQADVPAPVEVVVNNFNADLANDIRRAVPDAITVYYRSLGRASPIDIMIAEHPLRPRNVTLLAYSVLPIIILVTSVSGVIMTGLAATTEWERKTIKELLLAPTPTPAIIVGKVLAGFLPTCLIATGMLTFGAVTGLLEPAGLYWLSACAAILLASLFSCGLGIAVGAFFQRKQPVMSVATVMSVWLFSLAGDVGVLAFEPDWLQRIGAFDPLFYALHALQTAVFYNSFDQFGRDVAVLLAASISTVVLGCLALRRELILQ